MISIYYLITSNDVSLSLLLIQSSTSYLMVSTIQSWGMSSLMIKIPATHTLWYSLAKETSRASGNQQKSAIENKYAHLKWKTKKKSHGFSYTFTSILAKKPYFRLDNFPFFSSDFPVRNFLSTNFPFSRFSWEIAMPKSNVCLGDCNLRWAFTSMAKVIK